MDSPTLTCSPPPSVQPYTHESIHQSIAAYFQNHPATTTPYRRTIIMPIPTFSCRHQLLPIPPHTPYPPPTHLPFPCRACHMTATQSADTHIRARYDPAIRELDRQIALGNEKLWYEYEQMLADRVELVQGRRSDLKAEMEYEVRACWREFDARWGGPMR